MTENNAAQPGLTDDQIEALAKKHIAPHADRLEAIMTNPVPYQQTEQFRRVKALIVDVLSKLRAEGVQAGDEQCKRCGGPGWYTSHTTGYPESIPCSACNPQGVSVERLEKDPFLAAQLWRKPADGAEALLGRILEHVSEYGESMASSTLLSVRSIARRNVETRIAAELAAASTTSVPGFVDAYEGAREDLAIWKRRALEAERDLRAERETYSRLVAALNAENGPTHFGDRAALASAPVAELPERDTTKPAEDQGLFRKFDVRRTDGSDAPGGKHHGCRYFVLDVDHDRYAPATLGAYADLCEADHPDLARDLREKWGAPVAGEARIPPGYTITRRGDGLLVVEPPSGKRWVAEIQTPVGQFITTLLQDAAPQASEAVRDADHPVFAFLLGEGPLRGVHFGDRHPDERGAYWWRKDLRAVLSAQPGAQRTGGGDE